MSKFIRLQYAERRVIEQMLDDKATLGEIARTLGRSKASIHDEVVRNSVRLEGTVLACVRKKDCELTNVCEVCTCPDVRSCKVCGLGCGPDCPDYAFASGCTKPGEKAGTCNGCPRLGGEQGPAHRAAFRPLCNLPCRKVYRADHAQQLADARGGENRRGVRCSEKELEAYAELIRDGIRRKIPPYQIVEELGEKLPVSRSTVYRWIDRGYRGLMRIDLPRAVRTKPPKVKHVPRCTAHSASRRHSRFMELPEDVRARALEMDTVVGCVDDAKALLTLLHLPTLFQFVFVLERKTCAEVLKALRHLSASCPASVRDELFSKVVTDNGPEFSDEERLAEVFGEREGETRLYYCDPMACHQKARCERNHVELRKLLPKGKVRMDDVVRGDGAVIMSQLNSGKRKSLGGMSPIEAFRRHFGPKAADRLLRSLGVEQLPYEEQAMRPEAIDASRLKRGLGKLRRRR